MLGKLNASKDSPSGDYQFKENNTPWKGQIKHLRKYLTISCCFQEYNASVIVTSPNVPYKGTALQRLSSLCLVLMRLELTFIFLLCFDSNFSRQRRERN